VCASGHSAAGLRVLPCAHVQLTLPMSDSFTSKCSWCASWGCLQGGQGAHVCLLQRPGCFDTATGAVTWVLAYGRTCLHSSSGLSVPAWWPAASDGSAADTAPLQHLAHSCGGPMITAGQFLPPMPLALCSASSICTAVGSCAPAVRPPLRAAGLLQHSGHWAAWRRQLLVQPRDGLLHSCAWCLL
jgi:hypothetical protein